MFLYESFGSVISCSRALMVYGGSTNMVFSIITAVCEGMDIVEGIEIGVGSMEGWGCVNYGLLKHLSLL